MMEWVTFDLKEPVVVILFHLSFNPSRLVCSHHAVENERHVGSDAAAESHFKGLYCTGMKAAYVWSARDV